MQKKFKRIYIEISNICNLQCSFCPVVERDKDIMSTELFSKILKEGNKYLYSGISDSLYACYHWKNDLCKIRRIEK